MTKLVTIRSRSGAPFSVHADHAQRFQGLIDDLEASGYGIEGSQSGGYNYRTIDGSQKLSEHAFGKAVDINWGRNARGTHGDISPELARSLAAKHGLTWGGDWKNPDPMHFEAAGAGPTQMANRGLVTAAGLKAPVESRDAGSLADVLFPAPQGSATPGATQVATPFGLSVGSSADDAERAREDAEGEMPGMTPLQPRQIDYTMLKEALRRRGVA